ncbi:MAG: hypothetical protein HQL71_13330, partial [Magnetococcales bacterium]|nr:hypothetical protein [Magnetococcales bacterium]
VIGYWVLSSIWGVFLSVDQKLRAGLLAAFTTVIVSIMSVHFAKYLERKAEILSHLREKKIPTYEKIVQFIFRITFAEKLGNERPTDHEMIKFMTEITQEIVIWGSDEMVDALYDFRMQSIKDTASEENMHIDVLFTVENLLLAVRKDLGHNNKNLSSGKILGLFVNDLQEHISQSKEGF